MMAIPIIDTPFEVVNKSNSLFFWSLANTSEPTMLDTAAPRLLTL